MAVCTASADSPSCGTVTVNRDPCAGPLVTTTGNSQTLWNPGPFGFRMTSCLPVPTVYPSAISAVPLQCRVDVPGNVSCTLRLSAERISSAHERLVSPMGILARSHGFTLIRLYRLQLGTVLILNHVQQRRRIVRFRSITRQIESMYCPPGCRILALIHEHVNNN